MSNRKGTIIGTNKNPIVLGKKKRRPNINSQAYKDNYDRIFGKKKITTTSEQMQDELEPILKKWKKATLNEKPLLSLSVMS